MLSPHPIKISIWLLLAIINFFMIGCITINVMNNTNTDVVVSIRAPDSKEEKVRIIRPQSKKTIYSQFGGRAEVIVMGEDSSLIQDLMKMKIKLVQDLSNPQLENDTQGWKSIQESYAELDKMIAYQAEMAYQKSRTCAMYVSDYADLDVTITKSQSEGDYRLTCEVEEP